jgi:acetoin utilization protein AcuB
MMLVCDYMTHDPVTIGPNARLYEALNLIRSRRVHRLPVLEDNLLVGIISEKDLLYALPPGGQQISWIESGTRAAAMPIHEVMTSHVITVCPDCPIEQAAATMADYAVGALPVVQTPESRILVGIITETDIFKLFVEMLSSRAPGVRISLEINNRKGALASLLNRIVEASGGVVTVSSFPASSPHRLRIILKVADVDLAVVRSLLKPEETVIDLREIESSH